MQMGGVKFFSRIWSCWVSEGSSRLVPFKASLSFDIRWKRGKCGGLKVMISSTDTFSETT